MKNGDRLWVVSDKDNLTVGATAAPGGKPVFGEVVIPSTPVAINAGDSIGHLGFYQLPTECESESRYQVHIECFSTGDGLPAFLTNPEKAGEDAPAFLKYPEGAKLFAKDGEEKLVDAKRLTRAPGILTLSGVPVIKEGDKTTHYRIRPEGGWLAAGNVKLLSQWALGELGFTTLDRKPQSFDLLDGVNPPKNVVQGILQELYKVAQAEPRISAALYKYNYKYLLDEIDQNKDGYYSEREYLQAVHLPSYRDHLYRLIAKHPSEWYYGKADELWVKYLDTLKKDVPEWKTYLEDFIDRLAWMKQVPGIGPDPWHMHPVVFLDYLKEAGDLITLEMLKVASPVSSESYLIEILPWMNMFARKYNLNTRLRVLHFLAQCAHESEFKIKEENLNYQAKRMREVFGCVGGMRNYMPTTDECKLGRVRDKLWAEEGKYAMNASNLGSYVYADRMGNDDEGSGDGYKFRGRGIIQLTGKNQYVIMNKLYKDRNPSSNFDLLKNPNLITSEISVGVEVAFLFWDSKDINSKADMDNFRDVTEAINGGSNGLEDRSRRLVNLKGVFL